MSNDETLTIIVRAKDLASGVLKGIGKNVDGIGKHASRGLSNAIGGIQRLGLVAAGAAGGGLLAAIKWSSDFEAQLNTINTVAQVTPDQLTAIGDGIRQISRDTGTSTDDLTSAYYDLVSAGVKAADAQGVLTAANTLAIGGLATTGETVDLLTTALNAYGLSADKAGDVSDYFAQSIAAGKVTAAELAGSFAQVGGLAASSGIEIQELAAGYAQLTAKGTPAAEASTQMRSAIVALQKPTAELNAMQKRLNIDFAEYARENGLAAAYQLIRQEADKTGVPLIKLTGRIEGTNYALAVTGDNAAGYAQNLELVNEATEGAGVAADQANERQKGLAYQWSRLKAIAKDVGITIGSELLPPLADLAEQGADWLGKPAQQKALKDFAKDLAQGFRDAVAVAKSIDWGSVAGSLKSAAGFGKSLLDVFMGAPDWLKTAVVSGWGLNKLTGGAFAGIVGELAKGLVRGVLGITAAIVNVNGRVVNGGGVGGPGAGGPGAGGGVGGLIGGIAGGVTIGTALYAVGDQLGRLPTLLEGVGDAQTARTIDEAKAAVTTMVEGITVAQPWKAWLPDVLDFLAPPDRRPTLGPPAPDNRPTLGPPPAPERGGFVDVRSGRVIADAIGPKFDHALIPVIGAMDRNANGIVTLRETMASQLGLTVGELRTLKTASGGWNATLAAKLGISNTELQAMVVAARSQVGQLAATKTAVGRVETAVNRKDLSVDVNVNVSTTVRTSNRAIASDNYRTRRNAGVMVD